jgi:hypothetical protein
MHPYLHRYVYRPADWLSDVYYDITTETILGIGLGLGAFCSGFLAALITLFVSSGNTSDGSPDGKLALIAALIVAGSAIVLTALVLIGRPISNVLALRYDANHVTNYNQKITKELTGLLQHYGAMNQAAILHYYEKLYGRKLKSYILEKVMYYGEHFNQDVDTKVISLVGGTPVDNQIPIPENYTEGYYHLFDLLLAVKEQSDLADTPLSLIADLYDMKGVVRPPA